MKKMLKVAAVLAAMVMALTLGAGKGNKEQEHEN